MEINESRSGDVTILVLSGELDRQAAAELEAHVDGLLRRGAYQLLADLAELESIEAAGVRILLGIARRLERMEGQLVLCNLRPEVHEAIQVTGLPFTIRPDRRAALRLLPGGRKVSRIARLAARLLALGAAGVPPARRRVPGPDAEDLAKITNRAKDLLADPSREPPQPPAPPTAVEPSDPRWRNLRQRLSRWAKRVDSR